eukprot:1181537-Prorocentrum_minimum.AAC.3
MSAITHTMSAVPVTACMGSKGNAARTRCARPACAEAIAARKTNALRCVERLLVWECIFGFERRSMKMQSKIFTTSAEAVVETGTRAPHNAMDVRMPISL